MFVFSPYERNGRSTRNYQGVWGKKVIRFIISERKGNPGAVFLRSSDFFFSNNTRYLDASCIPVVRTPAWR